MGHREQKSNVKEILAKRNGGTAKVKKGYCRYFMSMPKDLKRSILCNGLGFTPKCPDYGICMGRKHKKKPLSAKNKKLIVQKIMHLRKMQHGGMNWGKPKTVVKR